MGFTAKIDRYRRRILHELDQRRHAADRRRREKHFARWLRQMADRQPEVLVGANFAAFGGVRNHIHAIRKFSSLRIELVPDESLLQCVSAHHFVHEFGDKFRQKIFRSVRTVHSHVYPWFLDWCREQQGKGIRWVHTYHLNYYPEHASGVLEPWQAAINEALLTVACKADIRLSVSRWQSEELLRDYQIPTEYLPNGVDVALCDLARRERFSRKTGCEKFVLYIGRNDPVKNPVEFVRLAHSLPRLRFVMAGGGLSDEALRNEWQVDLPPNLTVVGSLSHAEVQDALAACAALVVTSKREGLPTLVMEGMAHRKPVIVPDDAGCMEAVDHGDCGYVYRLGDIDDLAAKTEQALTDRRIGERARARVLREYDWRVVAPKLDTIYRGTGS